MIEQCSNASERRFDHPHARLTDEELFERYRRGHVRCFAVLVRRHERKLLNYLRKYLRNSTEAEDIVQNTLIKVHKNADQFRTGHKFLPWLYSIATHSAIDMLRKAGRHPMLSLHEKPCDVEQSFDRIMVDPDARQPLERLLIKEERAWIRARIGRLPMHLRSVVILKYYEDLTYCKIAEVLGVPLGTVKSRISMAMDMIEADYRALNTASDHA